jgi:hypothetical protein
VPSDAKVPTIVVNRLERDGEGREGEEGRRGREMEGERVRVTGNCDISDRCSG